MCYILRYVSSDRAAVVDKNRSGRGQGSAEAANSGRCRVRTATRPCDVVRRDGMGRGACQVSGTKNMLAWKPMYMYLLKSLFWVGSK